MRYIDIYFEIYRYILLRYIDIYIVAIPISISNKDLIVMQ